MLKNLDFKVKLSLGVLLIIILWIASGLFFSKKVVDNSSQNGGGKTSLLVSPVKLEEVYKVISGYGVIDRGEINVFSELNSHVLAVKKIDGSKVKRGEVVVELLSGVLVPSPIDGILDGINIRAGDVVFSGQTKMFSVVSDSKIEAVLRISSSEARFVKAGQKAKIEVGENIFTGSVYFVSRVSDKASNTFEVKIRLKSSKNEVFHGEVAKISIQTLKKSGVFVPTSALSITNDDKIIITILDAEGVASKIPVEVLQTKENGVWIAGDLSAAKFIVIRGGDFANVGDKPDYKVKI